MYIRQLSDIRNHPDYRLLQQMPACHCCLLSGSLIDTPAGPLPVEALRPGDHVWGLAHDQKVPTRIRKIYRAERERVEGPVYDLRTDTDNFFCQGVLIGHCDGEQKAAPVHSRADEKRP